MVISVKEALEAKGTFEEESHQVKTKFDNVWSQTASLQTEVKELEQSRTEMTYAQEKLTVEKKAVQEELAHYQSFLIRISKEGFNQGIPTSDLFSRHPD
ncbi:hypothetical protein ACSQ67_026143 [Phaseolus vulgaris]